jgi:Bacterial Ig-like domain (group 2)
LAALTLQFGCGSSDTSPKSELESVRSGFRWFSVQSMDLHALENPVPPPLWPGASPNLLKLQSTDASVVSISPDGLLIPHRNGEADVTTQAGTRLHVRVRTAKSLQLSPSSLQLRPGDASRLRVQADDLSIEADAVEWRSTSPAIVSVNPQTGLVLARSIGSARIIAVLEGRLSECEVEVMQ